MLRNHSPQPDSPESPTYLLSKDKYLLYPNQFSEMVEKFMDHLDKSTWEKKEMELETKKSASQTVDYYKLNKHGKKIVIFNRLKDAESMENEKAYPFFGDIVQQYYFQNQGEDCVMLIPLTFARGWLYLPPVEHLTKRAHMVLLEVNIESVLDPESKKIVGKNITLDIHDSKGVSKYINQFFLYPYKFDDMGWQQEFYDLNQQRAPELPIKIIHNKANNYHCYNKQRALDPYSCMYYAYLYLCSYIENGSSAKFGDIQINVPAEYKQNSCNSTTEFLQKVLFDSLDRTSSSSEEERIPGFNMDGELVPDGDDDWGTVGGELIVNPDLSGAHTDDSPVPEERDKQPSPRPWYSKLSPF